MQESGWNARAVETAAVWKRWKNRSKEAGRTPSSVDKSLFPTSIVMLVMVSINKLHPEQRG
jgi:hypothetical protein